MNEGVAEWPPSPWRLQRAFIAVWMGRLRNRIDEDVMKRILSKLAPPPLFHLPKATLSNTRHYMPWEKKGPDDRALVLDTFVSVDSEDWVVLHWPDVSLEPEEEKTLELLLNGIPYLGRSESWCEAKTMSGTTTAFNCRPLNPGEPVPDGHEVVTVLAPSVPLDFKALFLDTTTLRRKKLDPMHPPGTAWIRYARPRDCFEAERRVETVAEEGRPSCVQYALASSIPILLKDTVKVGDLARSAAMALYGRRNGGAVSSTLSGKGDDGRPLKGNRHAHYLPVDDDGDGRVDHLIVWAPSGLSASEREALASLHTLNPGGGEPLLNLTLQFVGEPRGCSSSICAESKIWRSQTPFVLIRHPKTRRDDSSKDGSDRRVIDGPEDQARLELRRRGFPEPVKIERSDGAKIRGRTVPWLAFHRWRRRGTSAGGAFGFTIEFGEPVSGPIALGYGARFGLGLFFPAGERGGPEDDRAS